MDYRQNKDFQAIVTSLQRQLKDVEQIQLQDFSAMKQTVEEHFQRCIKELNTRKNILINQLSDIFQKQETALSKMKEDLSLCVEVYKDTQSTGIKVFKNHPNAATQIWRGALALELPADCTTDQSQFNVEIDLPNSLLDAIRSHGTATSSFSTTEVVALNTTVDIHENLNFLDRVKIVPDATAKEESYTNLSSSSLASSSSSSTVASSDNVVSLPSSSTNKFSDVDMVITFAGSINGNKDGTGKEAQFGNSYGICFNQNDECFYICDRSNKTIRRMTLQGVVSTVVEVDNVLGFIAVYQKKNILFATYGHSIIKISPEGKIAVLAGDVDSHGCKDEVGTAARFYFPVGIAIEEKTGNIFVCDGKNGLIRTVSQKGEVTTLAGSTSGYKDGNGLNAEFLLPLNICLDESNQSLIVCDTDNDRVRRVSFSGEVSTLCEVEAPRAVASCNNGKFLIAAANKLYLMEMQGKIALKEIAGSGDQITLDGTANECGFNKPRDIAVHEPSNSCFITEPGGVIRQIIFK